MLLVLERVDAELVCAYAADRDERMTYYSKYIFCHAYYYCHIYVCTYTRQVHTKFACNMLIYAYIELICLICT